MKNLDKHEWDFSKEETYAIQWLESHGFDVVLKKRYISKDIFEVSKNGITDTFHLPLGDKSIKYRAVMEQFDKSFAMKEEIMRLREQLCVQQLTQPSE